MKLVNHLYSNITELESFIITNNINDSNSVLIQMFLSNTKVDEAYKIKNFITTMFPKASLVATSTAGSISDGKIIDNTVISFSIFENSTTKSSSYCHLNTKELIDKISNDLITSTTKLLICFANTFKVNSEELLKELNKIYPHIVIAGGNSGDDYKFESCILFSKTCQECDFTFVAIASEVLEIQTKYMLNYQSIGQEMTISRSEGTRVYEIDGKNITDQYKYYLGEDIFENILAYGTEFPLLINENGVNIARAPIMIHEDGSFTFGGDIEANTKVKFGFANVSNIDNFNKTQLTTEQDHINEAMYIYSCSARRSMLGNFLNDEISLLNKIAPTTGFITYGEFFHDSKSCSNNLLNITTTYVILNENRPTKKVKQKNQTVHSQKDISLKALTNLISKTSQQLDENIFFLGQFKNIINAATILSTTDEKGVITYVNKNFELISGYSKEELLGKPHNVVRHEDMDREIFKDMWETITKGHRWEGKVKNKRKDGSAYYVLSKIAPIYNKDGSFKEYIGIRTDITELEEYKDILQSELDSTHKSFDEKINYMKQYETAINSLTAVLKTDIDNKITYANEKFCEISGYKLDELIGLNCSEIRDSEHNLAYDCENIAKELKKKKTITKLLKNQTKDGSIIHLVTLFYPILNIDGEIVEHLQIIHDVSEIIALTQEIENTQKEVVLTMGAIGETRSKETGLHVKRVAEYSYLLATLYGLDETEANLLKQASPMHDIGKVGIPDNILNKPGKLTKEEFEIMKTHSEIGYEMLKHSQRSILKASSQVAYTHHEKWDGTGYPNKLKGEDIPIFGRITAIADVFDALGHDRCYKKAWELDDILKLFKEEKGKHFDPKLIDLFFENLDKFLEIRDKMND